MFASYSQQDREDEGEAFARREGLFSGSGALFDDIEEEEGQKDRKDSSSSRHADLESSVSSPRSRSGQSGLSGFLGTDQQSSLLS